MHRFVLLKFCLVISICLFLLLKLKHKHNDFHPIRLEAISVVVVTAYSPDPNETDSTPFIPAWHNLVFEGSIAVSRDLLAYLNYGDDVYLKGYGLFKVNDIMNRRYKKTVDIFMWSKKKAKRFGKQKTTLYKVIIKED